MLELLILRFLSFNLKDILNAIAFLLSFRGNGYDAGRFLFGGIYLILNNIKIYGNWL